MKRKIKNLKVNDRDKYKRNLKKKYKNPKSRGDKGYNKRNKR